MNNRYRNRTFRRLSDSTKKEDGRDRAKESPVGRYRPAGQVNEICHSMSLCWDTASPQWRALNVKSRDVNLPGPFHDKQKPPDPLAVLPGGLKVITRHATVPSVWPCRPTRSQKLISFNREDLFRKRNGIALPVAFRETLKAVTTHSIGGEGVEECPFEQGRYRPRGV
jgi:hypothetical protein